VSSSLGVVSRDSLVPAFVAVTFAFGTTAPAWSFTSGNCTAIGLSENRVRTHATYEHHQANDS
jgi:hypothetical protein